MFVPRKIKKIIRLLRGQISPVLAGIAVGLGFWFGLMPGFYGIHALLLVLLLLLNVPIGLFILFMGFGKAVSLAAAPVLFHTGEFVQTNVPGLINLFSKVPVAGITDFSHLALVGALLLGPICGVVIGLAFGTIILGFRKTWLKLEENKEKFNTWYNKKWVRILDWIVIGKRDAKTAKQSLESPTKYIRKAGAALAIVLLLIFVTASVLFQKQLVRDQAEIKLTEQNGATVDIAELSLSPVNGSMALAGLGVTDHTDPNKNSLQVGEISAKASVYQLSVGKLIMDEVKVADVQFNQERATPGEVLAKLPDGVEDPNQVTGPGSGDGEIPDVNMTSIEKYVEKYEEIKAWIEKIKPWLPKGEDEQPITSPQKYLDYLKARGGAEAAVRMWAKQVIMENVVLPSEQFGQSTVKLTNLNDAPQAAKVPVGLDIASDEGAQMKVQMHFDDVNRPGKVTGTFDAFDLSKMQSSLKDDNAIRFNQGKAGGTIEGYLTADYVDITLATQLTELQAQAQEGLFGLDAKTTQEALGLIRDLAISLKIQGPLNDPKISFDSSALKDQLVSAGKKRILNEVQKQINEKAPDEIKELMDSNDFKQRLDSLIRR